MKSLNDTINAVWGKKAPKHGETPAIALINPKYADNVAKIVRLASCYGLKQVWWTGDRVELDVTQKKRLPREERMRGYQDISMIQYDMFFDQMPKDVSPVAIEVRETSQQLIEFEHPPNPLYVFGPEDGSIPKTYLNHCHHFVQIPTRHCLNLATAVATVLYDRMFKMYLNGDCELVTPGECEGRGLVEMKTEDVLER